MPTIYRCQSGGGKWRLTVGCNHAMCQVCSRARAGRLWRRYGPVLDPDGKAEKASSVPMMTVTQVSEPGENARAAYKRFRRAWRRFLEVVDAPVDKRKFGEGFTWRAALELPAPDKWGGVMSVEWAPRPDDRWHVHGHSLMVAYVDAWSVRGAWAISQLDRRTKAGRVGSLVLLAHANAGRKLTRARRRAHPGRRPRGCECGPCAEERDQFRLWAASCAELEAPAVVDVRSVSPMEGFKYAVKGGVKDCSDAQLLELAVATKGVRRVSAWGAARAPKPPKGEILCPVCNGPADEVPDSPFYSPGPPARAPPDWRLREVAGELHHAEQLLNAAPRLRLSLSQELAAGSIVHTLAEPPLPAPFRRCWAAKYEPARQAAAPSSTGGASATSATGGGASGRASPIASDSASSLRALAPT